VKRTHSKTFEAVAADRTAVKGHVMKGALLGPQQLNATVQTVVKALALDARIALVTAGWQEREDQDTELHELLSKKTLNLNLYERGEQVFAKDKEYAKLHRARQDRMRQRQEYYRMRINRFGDAALDIARLAAGSAYEADEAKTSIESMRNCDLSHLAHCRAAREEFDHLAKPFERPSIAKHRAELATILRSTKVLAIAGGHVAVLLNRLRMFGIPELLEDQVLIAWSGGAMVTGERVVLFHESPPQGAGVSEIMDEGLGLHHGIVPLPNPKMRLRLDDPLRVGWLARRNDPTRCIAFDHGEYVMFDDKKWFGASGTQWLKTDGSVSPVWT
jgi:hypothetical protein